MSSGESGESLASRLADAEAALRKAKAALRHWRCGSLAQLFDGWRQRAAVLRTAKRACQRALSLDCGRGLLHWRSVASAWSESMRRAAEA